jgi:hypothetical protein
MAETVQVPRLAVAAGALTRQRQALIPPRIYQCHPTMTNM